MSDLLRAIGAIAGLMFMILFALLLLLAPSC